jgi:hypothetical protein
MNMSKQCGIPPEKGLQQLHDVDEQIKALQDQKERIVSKLHSLEISIVGTASGRSHGEELVNDGFDVSLDGVNVGGGLGSDIDFFDYNMETMLTFFKSFAGRADVVVFEYILEDIESGYGEKDVESWRGTLTMPFDEFITYFGELDGLRDLPSST